MILGKKLGSSSTGRITLPFFDPKKVEDTFPGFAEVLQDPSSLLVLVRVPDTISEAGHFLAGRKLSETVLGSKEPDVMTEFLRGKSSFEFSWSPEPCVMCVSCGAWIYAKRSGTMWNHQVSGGNGGAKHEASVKGIPVEELLYMKDSVQRTGFCIESFESQRKNTLQREGLPSDCILAFRTKAQILHDNATKAAFFTPMIRPSHLPIHLQGEGDEHRVALQVRDYSGPGFGTGSPYTLDREESGDEEKKKKQRLLGRPGGPPIGGFLRPGVPISALGAPGAATAEWVYRQQEAAQAQASDAASSSSPAPHPPHSPPVPRHGLSEGTRREMRREISEYGASSVRAVGTEDREMDIWSLGFRTGMARRK